MSKFGIIIRGETENKRFRPHMNHAIGEYIHTREDYLRGMKKHGLIPQEEAKKIAESKRRESEAPRKPSRWAHEMVEEMRRSKGKPGSAYYAQLEKRGYGSEKIKKMKKAADRAKGLNSNFGGFK